MLKEFLNSLYRDLYVYSYYNHGGSEKGEKYHDNIAYSGFYSLTFPVILLMYIIIQKNYDLEHSSIIFIVFPFFLLLTQFLYKKVNKETNDIEYSDLDKATKTKRIITFMILIECLSVPFIIGGFIPF